MVNDLPTGSGQINIPDVHGRVQQVLNFEKLKVGGPLRTQVSDLRPGVYSLDFHLDNARKITRRFMVSGF